MVTATGIPCCYTSADLVAGLRVQSEKLSDLSVADLSPIDHIEFHHRVEELVSEGAHRANAQQEVLDDLATVVCARKIDWGSVSSDINVEQFID